MVKLLSLHVSRPSQIDTFGESSRQGVDGFRTSMKTADEREARKKAKEWARRLDDRHAEERQRVMLSAAIESYMDDCKASDLAQNTIRGYRFVLKRLPLAHPASDQVGGDAPRRSLHAEVVGGQSGSWLRRRCGPRGRSEASKARVAGTVGRATASLHEASMATRGGTMPHLVAPRGYGNRPSHRPVRRAPQAAVDFQRPQSQLRHGVLRAWPHACTGESHRRPRRRRRREALPRLRRRARSSRPTLWRAWATMEAENETRGWHSCGIV